MVLTQTNHSPFHYCPWEPTWNSNTFDGCVTYGFWLLFSWIFNDLMLDEQNRFETRQIEGWNEIAKGCVCVSKWGSHPKIDWHGHDFSRKRQSYFFRRYLLWRHTHAMIFEGCMDYMARHMPFEGTKSLIMILVMEEILHQLIGCLSLFFICIFYIPGGCLGFLNHQQYHSWHRNL